MKLIAWFSTRVVGMHARSQFDSDSGRFRIRAAKTLTATIVATIFASMLTGALQAQEADWKVGLARVNVTPEEPVRMSGYASRQTPSEGINHYLYAKAMVLEDPQGNRGVIVTSDVIGFKAPFADVVCKRIAEKTGLQRHQILLNSSHTHTGPDIELDREKLSSSPEHAAATVRYSEQLRDKLVDLVSDAAKELQPANLTWSVGVAKFVMNRREFTENGVILGVNPRGLADRSVPVIRVAALDGTLQAILFGAACHNTTLGGRDMMISGDFAGYAQTVIERAHPGTQAMFMQGCAGDTNPFPRGSEEIARMHGDTLGNEVLRVLGEDQTPIRGPLTMIFETVDLPLQSAPTREEISQIAAGRGGWRRFVAEKMTEALDKGESLPTHYNAPLALWQFGDDLTFVGLSGEVVVDYLKMIEQAIGPRKLWVAAYCNEVYGYLPSARVLQEGGYETRGLYYGGVGLFSPMAQDVVVSKIIQMASDAGRKRAD